MKSFPLTDMTVVIFYVTFAGNFIIEYCCIFFRNSWNWNVSFWTNFKSIDMSFIFRYDSFGSINIFWCCVDWNISFSFNNDWLDIFTFNWYKMTSIDLNHRWISFFNWSYFVVEYISVNLRNSNKWDVSFISNFKSINLLVCNNWSADIFIWSCWMNWNVSNTS